MLNEKQKPDDGKETKNVKKFNISTFRKLYALKKACTVWGEAPNFFFYIEAYFNQYAIRNCYS